MNNVLLQVMRDNMFEEKVLRKEFLLLLNTVRSLKYRLLHQNKQAILVIEEVRP